MIIQRYIGHEITFATGVNQSQYQQCWELHQQLERGNPKRVFQGLDFREKT